MVTAAPWLYSLHLPPARWGHSAVLHGTRLLVFGGTDGQLYHNDVLAFELQPPVPHFAGLLAVTNPDDSPSPRVCHTAVLLEDRMVVVGGMTSAALAPAGSSFANDVHLFDCRSNTWSGALRVAGQPPAPRARHTAVVHRNQVVLLGGHDDRQTFSDLHLLTISKDGTLAHWSGAIVVNHGVPPPLAGHTACLHGDGLVVYGGLAGDGGPFLCDLGLRPPAWQPLPTEGPPPPAAAGHSAVMLGSRMVVFGGDGGVEVGPKGTARPDSYTLDLARRPAVWARLPEHGHTPQSRHLHVAVVHAPMAAMYLYGGCPHPLAKLPRNLNKPVPASGDAALGLYVFDLSALRPRDVAPALKVDSVMQDALGLVRRLRRQRAEETPGLPPTFQLLQEYLRDHHAAGLRFADGVAEVAELLRGAMERHAVFWQLQSAVGCPDVLPESAEWDALLQRRDAACADFLAAAFRALDAGAEKGLGAAAAALWREHAALGLLAALLRTAAGDAGGTPATFASHPTAETEPADLGDVAAFVLLHRHRFEAEGQGAAQRLVKFVETDGATAREWAQRADVCIAAAAAALRGAGRALAAGQTHAPVSLDAVVGAMVDAASREQLWYVGQGRRAAGLTPALAAAVSAMRDSLDAIRRVAGDVGDKLALLRAIATHTRDSMPVVPDVEGLRRLAEELEDAQLTFGTAKAALDVVQRQRRKEDRALQQAEEAYRAARDTLRDLRTREEEARRRLAMLAQEHRPELPVLHPDLQLAEPLNADALETVDGFLRPGRTVGEYDGTQRVHLHDGTGLRAQYEGQPCFLKEFAVLDSTAFKAEVRRLVRLRHPHLVAVTAVLDCDGRAYLELPPQLPQSMREWSWTCPPAEAICRLTGQVLLALQYLHARGVVHGALSWHTVSVTADGTQAILSEPAFSREAVQRAPSLAAERDVPPAPELRGATAVAPAPSADMWDFGFLLFLLHLQGNGGRNTVGLTLTLMASWTPPEAMAVLYELLDEDPARRATAEKTLGLPYYTEAGEAAEPGRRRAAARQVLALRKEQQQAIALALDEELQAFEGGTAHAQQRLDALCTEAAALQRDATGPSHAAEPPAGWRQVAEDAATLADALRQLQPLWAHALEGAEDVAAQEEQAVDAPEADGQGKDGVAALPPVYWHSAHPRVLSPLTDVSLEWRTRVEHAMNTAPPPDLDPDSGAEPGPTAEFSVTGIYLNENGPLWRAYGRQRALQRLRVAEALESCTHQELSPPPGEWAAELQLDAAANEQVLWCPTRYPLAHTLLGVDAAGLRLFPSAAAAHTAGVEGGTAPQGCLLLCRVCLGTPFAAVWDGPPAVPCQGRCPPERLCCHVPFGSVAVRPAPGRPPRHYRLPSTAQCYPVFAVMYRCPAAAG